MDSDPHIVPTLLAAAVIVVTAIWVVLQQTRTRPRRPARGPVTMDLGPEPPAVVDLLTDDFTVTPAAVPATLVDLAARRWLTIEEFGAGNVIVRLPAQDRHEPLAPFERRVLDHLRGLSIDGHVPAAAMTTGPEGASKQWWRAFRKEVIADAQARGLSRDRWTRSMLLPIWVGVVVAGALVWLAAEAGESRGDVAPTDRVGLMWMLVGLVTAGLAFWSFTVLGRDLQRDTDAGLEAAARWVGVREHMATVGDFEHKPAAMVALWDRYLAHAVALDLAPLVVAQLPLGAEDHRHAWSRASGRWRQVVVRYPVLRPGYGQHPLQATLGALVVGGIALFAVRFALQVRRDDVELVADLTGTAARGADIAALVLGGTGAAVLAWNTVKLAMALADLARTDHREGIALRLRVRRGWVGLSAERDTSEDRAKERFFCALDTGEPSVVTAWRVREGIFEELRQGDRYRVGVTPRLGYVRGVERA